MVWPKRKLADLADISRGSSPRPIADVRYFEGGTIPWVKIADATKSGKFLYETKEHVNAFGASFSRRLSAGTLLVAASGTLGYTQILGVPACAHDGWLILQNLRNLDRDFAYYALKTLERHFFNSAYGAAIQNINTEILRQTEVPCPPLSIQSRISGILSSYDDLIENNLRRIHVLEELTQALYKEWFVDFRFPGHENAAKVDSDVIPDGWNAARLSEIADINRAQISARNAPESLLYIDISCVSPGHIDSPTPYAFEDAPGRAKRVVRHGDTLWSCVRPNRRSHALVLNPSPNTIASTGFTVLSAKKGIPYTFIYASTTTADFVGYLTNRATGVAYPAVTAGVFEDAPVIVPSANLLEKYGELTIPMAEEINTLQRQSANLQQTRDLLLPRLMSGEIDASKLLDAESLEPAL